MMETAARLSPATLGAVLSLILPVPAARAGQTVYVVDPGRSTVVVHVGRAGLLRFAGHDHLVVAPDLEGEVRADSDDIGRCSVRLAFDAAALVVSEAAEPSGDAPKVRARMLGPDVLDVARFPRVVFHSTAVDGVASGAGVYRLRVAGEVRLHGARRSIVLPVEVRVQGETLITRGNLVLRQRDYGMTPVSVGGVVKVKDEVSVDFTITAVEGPARPTPGAP